VTPNTVDTCRSDTSPFQCGTSFGTRELRRLNRAREKGYLDARCRNSEKVRESFGLWCWRLKIPMVWFERQTPRSKYGRVQLELFTTANQLTANGQAALQAIYAAATVRGQVEVSPHNAQCDRVPLSKMEDLARAVFRIATRKGNFQTETCVAAQADGAGSWQAASA